MVNSRRMVSAWNCSTDFPRDRHGFHVWKFARVVALRSICNYKHSAGRTAPPAVTTTLTVQDWGDPIKSCASNDQLRSTREKIHVLLAVNT